MEYWNWDEVVRSYQSFLQEYKRDDQFGRSLRRHVEMMLDIIPDIQQDHALDDAIPFTSLLNLCFKLSGYYGDVRIFYGEQENNQFRIGLFGTEPKADIVDYDDRATHVDRADVIPTLRTYLEYLRSGPRRE